MGRRVSAKSVGKEEGREETHRVDNRPHLDGEPVQLASHHSEVEGHGFGWVQGRDGIESEGGRKLEEVQEADAEGGDRLGDVEEVGANGGAGQEDEKGRDTTQEDSPSTDMV
jgi:hypothetical protein